VHTAARVDGNMLDVGVLLGDDLTDLQGQAEGAAFLSHLQDPDGPGYISQEEETRPQESQDQDEERI